MGKRVADVLIETMQAVGVRGCYGIVSDTSSRIAHAIDAGAIDWVHMRHEEAGAFAAGAEGQLMDHLTACAGTCGPGSLHFIDGLYEANRNLAPVVLIATQIVRHDIGLDPIQKIDLQQVFKGCSIFCETILTPEQARQKSVAARQAVPTERGVAALVVPADVANASAHEERPYAVHARPPLVRPSDGDLDAIAAILNKNSAIAIYSGAGCARTRQVCSRRPPTCRSNKCSPSDGSICRPSRRAQRNSRSLPAAIQARAALEAAQQQFDQADANLRRTQARSTVNGYVTNLLMRVGDFAHQGTANASIIDSDSYWIDGYFEETKMARVFVGDRVEAKLMGYAQPIMGHVATVTRGIGVSNAAPGTQGLPNVDVVYALVRLAQRIPVRIAIDQAPQSIPLVSGMTATVTILEPADRRPWPGGGLATMAARLSDILDGPPGRPGCIPAITTERGRAQSLLVEREGPPASPSQLSPGAHRRHEPLASSMDTAIQGGLARDPLVQTVVLAAIDVIPCASQGSSGLRARSIVHVQFGSVFASTG
jgi:hypothetical protein